MRPWRWRLFQTGRWLTTTKVPYISDARETRSSIRWASLQSWLMSGISVRIKVWYSFFSWRIFPMRKSPAPRTDLAFSSTLRLVHSS